MPIILSFDHPITDKAAVERSLQVTTSKPVVGAWYWDGSQQLYFRPRDYWPAYTTVSFTGHLNGVEGAPGVYGVHDLTQSFSIGQSVIAVASTTAYHTLIYVGGQLQYDWPISTGRATMPTPDGTYLTVEKANPVRMIGGTKGTPGYYNELVNWAVRFTYSGDYYHSAPWSVVDQGTTNVSHGCVNLPPEDAQTYYNMAIPGDPITITSSPKGGNWDDGWTEWFDSWSQYLQGSATHMAVEAGPDGSTFISPSSLPSDTASAPLGTSDSPSASDLEQMRSSVKDVKVQMEGDRVKAYVVFDLHGKDMTLELVGRIGAEDGFLKFEPISGQLGALPIPQSTLETAVQRLMDSPENRDKLRLPSDISDMHIENGQLVATYH